MIAAGLVGLLAVLVFVWQDGVNNSQDGARYTSGKPQPSPFHRRFHAWPARLLMVLTWASFVAIAASMNGWGRALMLLSLPGVWMCIVMPTTVDGPAMALAVASSCLWPSYPVASVCCSILSGIIHERGPAFAAIYAGSPWLLVGLIGVQWWAKKGAPNHASPELADRLVGHKGFLATALAHRPHVDLLNEGGLVFALRGIPIVAAWQGAPIQAWVALAVAYGSRVVGTDTARCMMWAAPALLMHCDPPWWVVALHCMSFRRVMR